MASKMCETTNDVIVGIDLGTTNYSVVIYNNDGHRILQNEKEFLRVPCCVYFSTKNKLFVGAKAKKLENKNGRDGVYDAKRFLGREYYEKEVQARIPWMRYTVEEDSNQTVFVLGLADGKVYITPTEICSLILANIKEDIKLKLKQKCNVKAVITMPPHFKKNQQKAILEAAKIADLEVLDLLIEPSAIALHYFCLYEKFKEGDNILVYNLGGGSFNITILKLTADTNFEIVDVLVDTKLSGQDFDQLIFNYFWEICNFSNDLNSQANQMQIKSEEIKMQLSTETQSFYSSPCKSTTFPFASDKIYITRSEFEELAEDLLQETVDLVDQCLLQNNLSKSFIKKVFLSGGLLKIPKMQKHLMQYFGDFLTDIFVFGDTTVAQGAALHARMLSTKQL